MTDRTITEIPLDELHDSLFNPPVQTPATEAEAAPKAKGKKGRKAEQPELV